MNFIKRKFVNITSGALFSSITVLATVVVGAYISLYSSKIITQFDTICLPITNPCDKDYPEISVAIISIAILSMILLVRELSVASANNSARNKLQEIIKSTPSKSFLEDYTKFMRLVGTFRLQIKENVNSINPDSEKTHECIRGCLHGILSLAKQWDGNEGRSSIYRANIMTMVPSEYLDPVTISDGSLKKVVDIIDNGKLFLYNTSILTKVRKCSGILMLEDSSLTVSTNVAFSNIDDSIKSPICFPYIDQSFSGVQSQPIIPGAPACASFGTSQYLTDTKEAINDFIKSTQHKNKEYCNRFKMDINEYYNSMDEAQSILSIPIQYKKKEDEQEKNKPAQHETIAVLNIYRNRTGIFRDIESAMSFAQLMEPICYHFAKMLISLADIEQET